MNKQCAGLADEQRRVVAKHTLMRRTSVDVAARAVRIEQADEIVGVLQHWLEICRIDYDSIRPGVDHFRRWVPEEVGGSPTVQRQP